jgi:hypothetical protein
MLGDVPARCCELPGLGVPFMSPQLPFEAHLMACKLQLAHGELPTQMPLNPLGEAYGFEPRLALAPFDQHGLPSGSALLRARFRRIPRTCSRSNRRGNPAHTCRNQNRSG